MAEPKKLYYRRTFLNRPGHHSGARVLADVKTTRSYNRGATIVIGHVILADCSEEIALDFHATDPTKLRNSIHKAKLLAATFAELSIALESQLNVVGKPASMEDE